MSNKQCCGTSVGVLVWDAEGRLLVFDRATPPVGCAPVAGHALDEHEDYETAAMMELQQEVGVTATVEMLTALTVLDHWRPNRCRRVPANLPGHDWRYFQITIEEASLNPSVRETRNVRWATKRQLQTLARRTVDFMHGKVTEESFRKHPGLEFVWLLPLSQLEVIRVNEKDLALAEKLMQEDPN